MLETIETEIAEKELGIGLQFTSQIGNGRSITLTAGFPLTWDRGKINELLDKLADVVGRQAIKNALHDRQKRIEGIYHQINAQQVEKARFSEQAKSEWNARGKFGDFELTKSQRQALGVIETSIDGLQKQVLAQEAELEELKEQCR